MIRLAVLLPVAAIGIGCSNYDHVEFEIESAPPDRVTIDPTMIDVPAGIAPVVRVTAYDQRGKTMDGRLVLRSDNGDVLEVYAADGSRSFVLVGVAPGDTCVEVSLDDEVKECIPATVDPQDLSAAP